MMFKRLLDSFLLFLVCVSCVLSGILIGYQWKADPAPVTQPYVMPVDGSVVVYYENNNDYQRYAVEVMNGRGQIEEWSCLWALWNLESNWRTKAHNKSGAYGIAQLMPKTWGLIGFKKTSDGYVQVDAGIAYIDRRYKKSPCLAYAHHLAKGWY
jgi:hypothetical protein